MFHPNYRPALLFVVLGMLILADTFSAQLWQLYAQHPGVCTVLAFALFTGVLLFVIEEQRQPDA